MTEDLKKGIQTNMRVEDVGENKMVMSQDPMEPMVHEVMGAILKLTYRFVPSIRERVVSGIVARVRGNGYFDDLSQDELDLLPKSARRAAFHQINMGLITDKYRYTVEYRNRGGQI